MTPDRDPARGVPCPLQPEPFERPERQVQAQRPRRERHEAVPLAEGAGAVVQRIDHDGIDADGVARADDPVDRIEQQDLAEPRFPDCDGRRPAAR